MIAMAVLANTGQTDTPGKLAGLASESDLKWAVTCGLAIRLCRRLTNCAAPALFDSSLTLESDRVVLHLEDPVKPLYSNGAAKDLRNLADWLGVDWMVQDFEPGGQSD